MSKTISVHLEQIQEVLNSAKEEAAKFDKGNKSAGTRLRASMQLIKEHAQNVRVSVSETKNSNK